MLVFWFVFLLNVFCSANIMNCSYLFAISSSGEIHQANMKCIFFLGISIIHYLFFTSSWCLGSSYLFFYQVGLGNKLYSIWQPCVLCVFVWPEQRASCRAENPTHRVTNEALGLCTSIYFWFSTASEEEKWGKFHRMNAIRNCFSSAHIYTKIENYAFKSSSLWMEVCA